MHVPELSLVIPLYNEEANLPTVPAAIVGALEDADIDYELVLVNNGSADRTGAVLDDMAAGNPRIRVVTVAVNQGFGWGVISGLAACRGSAVGYMGGDGQIRPQDVVRVYRVLRERHVHLAKVRRVVRRDGLARRVVTTFCNALFPLLFPVRTWDINGTPKIMRAPVLRALRPESKDWFIDAEVMIKLGARKGTFAEVDVEFLARREGASNVRWVSLLEFLVNILRWRMEPWRWRPRPDEEQLPRNGRTRSALVPEEPR
jgi:glycosyltransferase involved in cell wall biosynthesis